jgi:hypothetical protein
MVRDYHIQNGFNNWSGGYLDTRGIGCEDNLLFSRETLGQLDKRTRIPFPDAKAAIESVTKAESGKDGITYLAKAIDDGVNTPLTKRYAAAILAKIDTAPIDTALLKEALKPPPRALPESN